MRKLAKLQHFLIIILGLVAVVLGIFVGRDYSSDVKTFFEKFAPQKQTLTQSDTSSQAQEPKEATSSVQRRPLPPDLTDEEKALLNPPAPNAPKEEKDQHYELLFKLAKESEVLDLKGCIKPDPLALKLKEGSEFKAKSSDGLEHTIVINQDYKFEVEAGQTATFKANFPFGQGAYGYLCDSQPGVVGFFFVTPK